MKSTNDRVDAEFKTWEAERGRERRVIKRDGVMRTTLLVALYWENDKEMTKMGKKPDPEE